MRLIVTGTGTSQGVPVLGCHCKVCTSLDLKDQRLRAAAVVQDGDTTVAIDIGPDFRTQMLGAGINSLNAVLLTHEHNDHIIGMDDLRPYNFAQQKAMKIYGLPRVVDEVRNRFAYIFSEKKYPGAPRVELIPVLPGQSIKIGSLVISPLAVSHGSLDILGFRFGEIVYITDANSLPDDTMREIQQPKILILNALHHRQHHSHFNLGEAIRVAHDIGASRTYFTHISHSMGMHQQVNPQLPAGMELAYDGLQIDI